MSSSIAQSAVTQGARPASAMSMASKPPRAKKPKFRKFKSPPVDPISNEGVLRSDIKSFLESQQIDIEAAKNDMNEFFNRNRQEQWHLHGEKGIEVTALSSVGVGLGLSDGKAVVVPYSLPGDKVLAKVYRTEEYYLESEIIKVLSPSDMRDDSLVSCKYFARCSGCQFQMASYDTQLELKRQTVLNAFKHYAPKFFASERFPNVNETVASPLHYNYRTKITPHFDDPKKFKGEGPVPIGFGERGRKDVLDIEECSIATSVLNKELTVQRKNVLENISSYKKGATILLREEDGSDGGKACCTDNKKIITETVGDFKFQFPAGAFFQNNNSILPIVTAFVREHIQIDGKPPKFLVDTYCGSGLFGITCSAAVERVIGVDVAQDSIEYATKNAKLNGVENCEYIAGSAEAIFEKVNDEPGKTAVIIDPSRKGCNELFLNQLLDFAPAKIVYVSCNVHSQARDLEYFLERSNYKVESLGGFDFFPQTHHVESVCVLSKESSNC